MVVSDYEALAKNVVRRSLHIQPKENVIVDWWNHGLDAAKEIVYQLRAVGARPMLLLEDEETHWRSVEDLPPRSWDKSPPRNGPLSRRPMPTSSSRAPQISRGTARIWRNLKPPPRTTRTGTAARNGRASGARESSWGT